MSYSSYVLWINVSLHPMYKCIALGIRTNIFSQQKVVPISDVTITLLASHGHGPAHQPAAGGGGRVSGQPAL